MIFTSGPVCSGFMEITASSDSEFGSISEQVGSWGCSGPGTPCFSSGNQYLPVTLGVPLELAIMVTYGGETGSALGTIRFSLFEATTYTPPFFGSGAVSGDLPLFPGDPGGSSRRSARSRARYRVSSCWASACSGSKPRHQNALPRNVSILPQYITPIHRASDAAAMHFASAGASSPGPAPPLCETFPSYRTRPRSIPRARSVRV